MKNLLKLLDMKYGELIFGLICGLSYFAIALQFIMANTYNGGLLLASFFAPVIICGIAIVFIKIIRSWRQNEQFNNIVSFMILHIIVLLIAIFFVADYIINGFVK